MSSITKYGHTMMQGMMGGIGMMDGRMNGMGIPGMIGGGSTNPGRRPLPFRVGRLVSEPTLFYLRTFRG
jgi:hypothetical protein